MINKRGVTLIELLVVAGLLIILAAVAVPHFLEAEIRSKVARVRVDMRTVGLALETYVIDQGRLSDSDYRGLSHPTRLGLVSNEYSRKVMRQLTTPVAYLGQGDVIDLFAVGKQAALEPDLPAESPPFVFGYLNAKTAFEPVPGAAEGLTSLQDGMVPQAWIDTERERFLANRWVLQSVGPDRINFCRGGGPGLTGQNFPNAFLALTNRKVTHYIYDPSNGTVSVGDIVLTGKGFLR